MDRWIGEWCSYNFAAGSFHTKKLCSRLFSTEVEFYWHKQRYRWYHRPVWGQMVKYHVLVPAWVITLLWVLASSVYRCWLFSDRDSTVVVCLLWSADNPGWSWSLAGYVTWRDDVIAGACSRRGDWWIDTLWIVAPVCVAVVCIFILALIIVLTRYQNNLENAGDNSRKSLETRKIRLPFLFV